MCGRFSLNTPAEVIADRFGLLSKPKWMQRYNIAPTQPVPTVRVLTGEHNRTFGLMRWGLILPWAEDDKTGSQLISARAETASQKPAFRSAFRQHRCLVLADGFYEWKKLEHGGKQPYYIRRTDCEPFAFAGLWERWEGPDMEFIESCSILTTQANELVAQLHNRMPVILQPKDYDLWLDQEVQAAELVQPLLKPSPAGELIAFPVHSVVNSPANDGPSCIEPLR